MNEDSPNFHEPNETAKSGNETSGASERSATLAIVIVVAFASVKLCLHLYTNIFGPYEFHRDEFLYFAMGEHLNLWRMDFPPLIAIASEVTRGLLGDSLVAIRFLPAILSIALLLLAARTAKELGGGWFAQGFAAFGVLASTLFLRTGNLFQPVVFDQLWWTLGLFFLLKLNKTNNPRWWIGFGLACGFGLLTKHSILIFGLGVFLALIATPARRWLKTTWPWLGAFIVFVVGSPSIVGQIALGFPILDQMSDLRNAQLSRVSPLDFVISQPRMMAAFPVAVVGAIALAIGTRWRDFRLVGWSCIAAFVLLILLKGKAYYVGPIYPVLLGAGAVVFERYSARFLGPVLRWGFSIVMVVYLIVLLPLGLPILAPEKMDNYLVSLGMQGAATTNIGQQESIPQDYADMLNWREQAAEVARVYHSLPEADRERAVIMASNYGEAGALDFYGPAYDIPKVVSIVGSYWFFGPGELPGEVLILHGFAPDEYVEHCGIAEQAGFVSHPYAVAEERDLSVVVCREPRTTLQELWPSLAGIN